MRRTAATEGPPPGIDCVGREITDTSARDAWLRLVLAVHEAAGVGGPLEGFVFHGTSHARAASIARDGVSASAVLMRDPPAEGEDVSRQWWAYGTHWATAWIAAFYAEDRKGSDLDAQLPPVLVAVPLAALELEGAFVPDEQSVDSPIESRLGRTADELWEAWNSSGMDWEASLEIMGSFVCLGPVGPERLHTIGSPEDLARVVSLVHFPAPR